MRNPVYSFDEIGHAAMSSRDVVAAWVIVILLLIVSMIGFFLDQAATIAP